jgi:hypothetical protein
MIRKSRGKNDGDELKRKKCGKKNLQVKKT